MFRLFMAIGLSIGLLTTVAVAQEKKQPSAPNQLRVESWCGGAYSSQQGTNFGPCPGDWKRPWMSIQSPGSDSSSPSASPSASPAASPASGSGPGGHSGGHK